MSPNSAYWERFEDPLHLKSCIMTVDAEVLFFLFKHVSQSYGRVSMTSCLRQFKHLKHCRNSYSCLFSCAKRPLSHVKAPQKWLTGEMPAHCQDKLPPVTMNQTNIKPIHKASSLLTGAFLALFLQTKSTCTRDGLVPYF